jgi:hypothetical protein
MSRLAITNLSFCETAFSTNQVNGGFGTSFLFPLISWSSSANTDFESYYSNWFSNKKLGALSYTLSDKVNNSGNEKIAGISSDGTHYSFSRSISV